MNALVPHAQLLGLPASRTHHRTRLASRTRLPCRALALPARGHSPAARAPAQRDTPSSLSAALQCPLRTTNATRALAAGAAPAAHSPRPLRRVAAAAAVETAAAAATAATTAPAVSATAAAATAAAGGGWSALLATLLGYCCLVGSCFRSVPQISKILKSGTAEGLSLTSNAVELACFTVSVAYNIRLAYPFNTYGEVFACWVQDVAIVALILRHMRMHPGAVAAAGAAFAAGCAWLFSPACPMELLSGLQLSTIAVMALGARLPQIALNLRRGNAGVLSAATCGLNVAGCAVRVFTTLALTGDAIILWGCLTQLALNAVLLYQSIAMPGLPPPAPASSEAAAVEAVSSEAGGGASDDADSAGGANGVAAAAAVGAPAVAAAAGSGTSAAEQSTSQSGGGGGGAGGQAWPLPSAA